MHELIRDVTLCIPVRVGRGLFAHFLRQPLILAYLIAGFVIGPFGTGRVKLQESIGIIARALAPLRVPRKSMARTRS
jgi:Kef-type K+ transport system membrane component KefB